MSLLDELEKLNRITPFWFAFTQSLEEQMAAQPDMFSDVTKAKRAEFIKEMQVWRESIPALLEVAKAAELWNQADDAFNAILADDDSEHDQRAEAGRAATAAQYEYQAKRDALLAVLKRGAR